MAYLVAVYIQKLKMTMKLQQRGTLHGALLKTFSLLPLQNSIWFYPEVDQTRAKTWKKVSCKLSPKQLQQNKVILATLGAGLPPLSLFILG